MLATAYVRLVTAGLLVSLPATPLNLYDGSFRRRPVGVLAANAGLTKYARC
jgi:hypothetical protein